MLEVYHFITHYIIDEPQQESPKCKNIKIELLFLGYSEVS